MGRQHVYGNDLLPFVFRADLDDEETDCDGNYRFYGEDGDPAIRVYVA